MENKFESNTSKHRDRFEELNRFGNLLKLSRSSVKKTQRQVASELGVSVSQIDVWERKNVFPDEPRINLAKVASVYGIELNVLKDNLEVSKAAKDEFKNAQKPPKGRKVSKDNEFNGPSGPRKVTFGKRHIH